MNLGDDAEARSYLRLRAMQDTGVMCREVLGWNYDEDELGNRINVGTGGIRNHGIYQRITDFLDNPNEHYKLLMTPRGSYKSTWLQGRICREIAIDPNTRILYGMKTQERVLDKANAIRSALESPRFTSLFGPQKGPVWTGDTFTVAGRTQTNLQEPTFCTFSLESLRVGGHFHLIAVDDFIDIENCRTKKASEYSKTILRHLFPLLVNGGYLLIAGTMYGEDDFYHEIMRKSTFDKLVLGAGVHVIRKDDQTLDLVEDEGGITFPHLTLPKLRVALDLMSSQGNFYEFSLQYLNEIPSAATLGFRREMFMQTRWNPAEMQNFTGYLLTDSATSERDEGCYSVLAYVLIDQNDTIYVADLRVGHMRPWQFVEEFFDMLTTWKTRVLHCGEAWEEISLTSVFRDMVDQEARRRQVSTNAIAVPRHWKDQKHARIERLEPKMRRRQFYVLNTVPRTFQDLDAERLLFDPEGYVDPRNGNRLPGGELVEEFVRLRFHPKTDIADALAMVVEYDRKTNRRFFQYRAPNHRRHHQRPNPDATGFTPATDRPILGRSWWDDTIRNIRTPR